MNPFKAILGFFSSRARISEAKLASTTAISKLFHYGEPSHTGIVVSEESALRMSAVYAAVRILSESVASLPLVLYRRTTSQYGNRIGRQHATDHPLYNILHTMFSDEYTSFESREIGQAHLCLRGNAYYYVGRNGGGGIQEIIPIHPDRVTVERESTGNRELAYRIANSTDASSINPMTLKPSRGEILHVRGMGFDGICGVSPISYFREAIGLGLATEQYGARFFSGGAHPRGVIEHPQRLSDEARKNLKVSWEEAYGGLRNANQVAVLDEGMSWRAMAINNEDSQFLETRKFQVNEIARIFRIPPHLLADLDKASYANIEQQSLEFVMYSLSPWLQRWEQAMMRDLLTMEERQTYFIKFNMEGLLRGDSKSRKDFYMSALQNGWMSFNEIREKEDIDPRAGGDMFLVPKNFNLIDENGEIMPDPNAAQQSPGSGEDDADDNEDADDDDTDDEGNEEDDA